MGAPGTHAPLDHHQLDISGSEGNHRPEGKRLRAKVSCIEPKLTDTDAVNEVFDSSLLIGRRSSCWKVGSTDQSPSEKIQDEIGGHRHTGHRILNEVLAILHSPSFFTYVLGLNLCRADIVVVKILSIYSTTAGPWM